MKEDDKTSVMEESPGVQSSVRWQMFITLGFAFLVIGYQVYINDNHVPDFLTMVTLLTASVAPKAISKFAELKNITPNK